MVKIKPVIFPLFIALSVLISRGETEERREVLSILYTGETGGDLFPRLVEGRERGGAARRKGLIDEIRQRIGDDHLLLLDAGDAVGTDYLARADSGKTVIDIMRRTGYEAMVLGNHEFDYGQEVIGRWPAGDRFHLLGANILREDGTPLVEPVYLTEKAGGVKIAVIGLTDKQIEPKILKAFFKGLRVEEPSAVANRLVPDLRGRVDLIVVISHLPPAEALQLARKVKGIDLVIGVPGKGLPGGGDSNDYTMIGRIDGGTHKGTLLVNTTPRGMSIGRVNTTFIREGTRWRLADIKPAAPLPVDDTVPVDTEIHRIINRGVEQMYIDVSRRRYGVHPDSTLLKLKDDLTPGLFAGLVGQVLCDLTGAEIALLNRGFFNFEGLATVNARSQGGRRFLTVRDLETIMWAENTIVTMKLTGSQIRSLLQRSESTYPDAAQGGYLFHHRVIYKMPGLAGVTVNGLSLQDRDLYKVVTTDFLASGGDGYTGFTAGTSKESIFQNEGVLHPDETGKPVVIRESVQAFFHGGRDRPADRLEEWLSRRASSYRNIWRVALRGVRVNVKDVAASNNERFRGVTETKVQTKDVVNLAGGAELQLEREARMLNTKINIRFGYGKVRTSGQADRETDDDLQGEAAFHFKRRRGTGEGAAPVVVMRYDTEFTPTETGEKKNPLQRDLITTFGFSSPKLWHFEELRFGLASIYDVTARRLKGGLGVETTGRYRRRFRGTIEYRGDYRLLYIFPWEGEKPTDTEFILQLRNGLTVPLVGNLSLIPGVDLYLFRAKVVGGLFRNAEVTLALSCSKEWKVVY